MENTKSTDANRSEAPSVHSSRDNGKSLSAIVNRIRLFAINFQKQSIRVQFANIYLTFQQSRLHQQSASVRGAMDFCCHMT